MNVAAAIARTLVGEGVDTAFGLMGDGNMHVVTELEQLGVTFVAARHEGGAMSMATGYAVASRRAALCTVTCGPGLTQIVTSLVSAVRRRVPVVVFAGEAGGVHDQQYLDQRHLVEATGALYLNIASPDDTVDVVREAFSLARRRRLPVVLGAGIALQRAEYPWGWNDDDAERPADPPAVDRVGGDPLTLERLAVALRGAQRPIIVAGEGAMFSDAHDELIALAKRTGAATATTLYAKGWLDDDEFCLGIAGAYSSQVAEECFAEADLVVAFGASLNRYTTEGGLLFGEAVVASVNTDPHPPTRYADPDIVITGDARRAAEELLAMLGPGEPDVEGFRGDATRKRLDQAQADFPIRTEDGSGLDPRGVVRALETVITDEDQLVLGVGHFQDFVMQYLRRPQGGRFTFSLSFGSIGEGLTTAIGVAFAHPSSRVIVFDGDGSLITSIQELDTVARYNLNLITIVMDDEGLGAEFHKLDAAQVESGAALIRSPDLVKVATGFGMTATVVSSEADLADAVESLRGTRGPRLVDVRISQRVVSDPFLKLYFGQENRSPHQVI